MADYDLFDILDISHREDSYSRLLVEVLRRHEDVRNGVFANLTGREVISWPTDAVRFRKALPPDGGQARGSRKIKQNIPDLWLKANTEDGKHWLLIETKIWSGEGARQCERYQAAAAASLGRKAVSGCYLTLRGKRPASKVWPGRKLLELYQIMSAADTHERIVTDPMLGTAWSAFGRRLKHHDSYPVPKIDQSITDYLKPSSEYFVTSADRCARVAEAMQLPHWETLGSYYHGRGREYGLLQAWKTEWLGNWLDPNSDLSKAPLDEHLSIHFEAILPTKGTLRSLSTIKCAVHFETYPYMTQHALQKHPHLYGKFKKAADVFQESLHHGIKGSAWTARRYALQKASINLEFDAPPTVDQLAAKLRSVMEMISDAITDSLEQARQAAADFQRR